MDETLWARTFELFHAALELPEAERAAFIEAAAGADTHLRDEVRAMLAADRSGASRLSPGIADNLDRIFEEDAATTPFRPPERIGPYEPDEFLGRGGMGAVWRARRTDTGGAVAIKFLLPFAEFPQERRRRFAEEIAALARLRHPHIVSFHDAGELEDRTPWFVMDYVEEYERGMRFTTYCRLPAHTIERRLRIFRAVCDAVLYAHRQGILHRDLKPSNILIAKDETPRIVDFGIARRLPLSVEADAPTRPSMRFLSDEYAAPEWKRFGQTGTYTDVYSLGVMLYEILCGRRPSRCTSPASSGADADTERPPERPSKLAAAADTGSGKLSRSAWNDLDRLCLTAMHRDPLERYPSVESLIRDIDHYLNDEPLEAQPKRLRYRTAKFVKRNRRALLASAAVFVLIIGMAALFTGRLARERNAALEEASRAQHIQDFMTDLLEGSDKDAGPAANLPVTAMIDRGVKQATELQNEPAVQADLYRTLGSMSHKLGRLRQADELLTQALARDKSLSVSDQDATAVTEMALALVRSDEGRATEAEYLARHSLGSLVQHYGDRSLLAGRAELTLGTVLVAAGRYKDALPVLKQAATLLDSSGRKAALPEAARTYAKLGDASMYLGNYSEAEAYNRKALALDRATYGNSHPHIGEDLSNLAQLIESRGRYSEAEPLERQALTMMQQWYGADHPESARKMTTLASTLLYENKNEEADDLLRRALAIQEKTYGPQHPLVAYVINSLGVLAMRQKMFAEAEADYLRMAEIYRLAYGDQDFRVAVALGNLASVYLAEERYPECERLLFNVVDRFTRAQGARSINTAQTQVRLGRTLLRETKYAQAEEHSRIGYEILSAQTDANTSYVVGARHDLALEYAALGNREKAEQFGAARAASFASSAGHSR